MHELSDEWNGEWSNEDMATALNAEFGTTVTAQSIGYHCKWVLPGDWDLRANVRAEPLLLKSHRKARVTFAKEALAKETHALLGKALVIRAFKALLLCRMIWW